MSANDGGPAFPAEGKVLTSSEEDAPAWIPGMHSGMALRDYFAAQALAGMTGGGWRPGSDEARETLAINAYQIADAMLAERSKGR